MTVKNTVLLTTLIASATLLMSTPTHARTERIAQKLCNYIAADDKNRLRKNLRDARLKIRDINNAIECSGHSLLRYSFVSQASDVGEYIIKSIPKSHLQTQKELHWVEANGFGGTSLADVLRFRVKD